MARHRPTRPTRDPGARRRARGARARGRGPLVAAVAAAIAVIALVATAVVAKGYSVTQTPPADDTVWALQTGQGARYASINTSLAELQTVKDVRSPSDLVQTEDSVAVYSQNDAKVAAVDQGSPPDLGAADADFGSTPSGTLSVVSAGGWIAYRTSDGGVYAAPVGHPAAASAVSVDPENKNYSSDAITVGTDGVLYSYSHSAGEVTRVSLATGQVLGSDAVAGGPTRAGAQLTAVGDTWALLDSSGAELWLPGVGAAISTGLGTTALLQQPSAAHSAVVVADQSRLEAFALGNGAAAQLDSGAGGSATKAGELGTPAAPYWSGTALLAAWLPYSTAGGGTIWTGGEDRHGTLSGTPHPLSYGGQTLSLQPVPVFRSNGQATILNDSQSGWVWNAPSGALVPSSQQWDLATEQQRTSTQQAGQVATVTDPRPPIAEPDAFGVRAGSLVRLPVLLNDHDPNQDVLTIIPTSVAGLPPSFGTVSVTDNSQELTVDVGASATGTATFHYSITDGTTADGLDSKPATVTLTVHPPGANSPPVWCGVSGCLQQWPAPQLAPGGTVSVPVLTGWVDPDGDPLFVSSATVDSGGGTVSTTPDGQLVYQHPDTAVTGTQTVDVDVAVSDVHGATAHKTLSIVVTPRPELSVQPFAVETSVDQHLVVDPSTHITGAAGTATIASVTVPQTAAATVSVATSGTSFDFSATSPGSYPVAMTVADHQQTATALVRVTVVPAGTRLLTTAPITVFVRPEQDTSVDPFTAVTDPSGEVLLLSDAKPKPAPGASLDVDIVGQAQLRVRGTTETGQPGLLGTVGYQVSTGDGTPPVQGQATVYLLPDPVPAAPIAVADVATVRVGNEVDIPVLSNDVAPDGNTVELDPASVRWPTGQGLAFASGSTLRYLAPETPGTVVVHYSDYVAGSPQLTSTTTATITVVPEGSDRPPQPQTLTGRVLSGQTVSIPFSSFGLDPDGDTVALDRIATQPAHGTASISAAGDALVYSSTPGYAGQDSFSYQVRDPYGDVGTALVRVGVLDALSDPAPIAYSDYVQVQAGSGNQVVVDPAANDVDPAGSALAITSVTPDASRPSAQYSALASHLKRVTRQQVVITAPAQPGTLTYTYSVSDAAGNVGSGLIVVKVVAQPVPDYPVVSDTVVSAAELAQLPHGIDVVTGKVSWSAGDPGSLVLSLWGDPRGASVVNGTGIRANAPAQGAIIPFQLSGRSFSGQKMTSYGFLRIPARSAIILALKPGTVETVDEAGSKSFDMTSLVSVPPGEALGVDASAVHASGVRSNASCTASGTRVTYIAGRGSPYLDSCLVPVWLAGQGGATTLLAVPISVIPLTPEPVLHSASLTANPGGPAVSYDLRQLTTWQGTSDLSSLQYAVTYDGSLFDVVQDGAQLTVRAKDASRSGLEETIGVRLVNHPMTADGAITLKVGPAPSTLPQGGTVSQNCSEANGSSCTIHVIGVTGEVNDYPSTPLQLVSVSPNGSCTGVTFAIADSADVRASWTAATPGGVCQTRFVVRDAQGRLSGSAGDGTIELSLQGFPQAPASVEQTGYDDGIVQLTVDPGAATAAYPPLQGFGIYLGGQQVGACDTAGSCTSVSGLANGHKQTFAVRSINGVGTSRAAVSTVAWAYAPPGMGSVTTAPMYDPARTSSTTGVVQVTIQNTDAATQGYDIVIGGVDQGTTPKSASTTTVASFSVPVQPGGAAVEVDVTPVSSMPKPSVTGATSHTEAASAIVAGSPAISSFAGLRLTSTSSSITVGGSPSVSSNGANGAGVVDYVATPSRSGAPCSIDAAGSGISVAPAATGTTQKTISGLTTGQQYDVYVCYTNGFGLAQAQIGSAYAWDQPTSPPTGWTYSISSTGAAWPQYQLASPPSGPNPGSQYAVVFGDQLQSGARTGGQIVGDFGSAYGVQPEITVEYCLSTNTSMCGPSGQVTAASGSPLWPLNVTGAPVSCAAGSTTSNTSPTVTIAPTGTGGPNGDGGLGGSQASALITAYTYWEPVTDSTTGTTTQQQQPPVTGVSYTPAQLSAALPPDTSAIDLTSWQLAFGRGGFPNVAAPDTGQVACQ